MNWHDLDTPEKMQVKSFAASYGWKISLSASENMIRFGKEITKLKQNTKRKQNTVVSINLYWNDAGEIYKISTHRKNQKEGRTHKVVNIENMDLVVKYFVNPALHPNEIPKKEPKYTRRK
mgnify:CR=1 FL=1|tara:strand:- start:13836 stop:14195 length:360 start_codon:yes stop_codon:yes gene_type:complete